METTSDPVALVRATDRRVVPTQVYGLPARVVTAARTYRAEIDDVWDALTSAERLPRWFAPVTGDLELGGRYQVEGNAGGSIEACEAPRSFAVTWEFMGATSWLAVELAEVADGTRLRTTMEVCADLPLPRISSPAVTATMKRVMATMGDRFSRNLLDHLGVRS